MKRRITPFLAFAAFGAIGLWLVLLVISPKSDNLGLTKGLEGLNAAPEPPLVASLITDPFFHPAIQPVLPPAAPADANQGSLSSTGHSTQPVQPVVGGPLTIYPSPQPPQPLPGTFPAPDSSSRPPVETGSPVRISLQGVVVGDRPAAFLRVNDSPSAKAQAGAQLQDGITVLTISDNEVTVSRKGKTLTLKPGQVENL